MNKKLGILLIGGMLVLGACGEEEAQPAANEPVEEEMDTSEEVVEEEEEVVEEEATEEAVEEEATEEPMTDAAEAASGEASPLLKKGDMTSFVFNEPGEFKVFCEPHPVMKMTVVVEEGATTSGEVALDIADYAFSENITVAPGTVITWTNQDSAQHNVAFE